MPELSASDLDAILSGDPDELGVYLHLVERDLEIEGLRVRVHCHCLPVDGNGRVQPKRLAEFMRNAAADYAIPRSRLEQARARDLKFSSTSAVASLHNQARAVFTDLATTGEGGEMLVFLLAQRYLGLPQVLCKMDLKTDTRMHYHGADGVYASVTNDGKLRLYWGESKVYGSATTAIRDCLTSLAPFLSGEEGEHSDRERDLILLSDKADLGDERLTSAFKRYFDRTQLLSNRVEYCGIAFVGFDAECYPADKRLALDEIENAIRSGTKAWLDQVRKRTIAEKLDLFEIQLFLLPLPSVEKFRQNFLEALRGASEPG